MAPAISFVPIAGKWSGIVTERQPCCGESDYRVEMTLADSAPHGAQIGTVAYQDLGCGGILRAMRRIGDVYEVEENITMGAGCVPVLAIALTHDPTTETLGYAFGATPSHGGRAVLERDE